MRFEVSITSLAPDLRCIAPVRDLALTRDKAIDYAVAHNLPIETTNSNPFSIDQNVWGRAIETGYLKDSWNAPTKDVYNYTDDPAYPPLSDGQWFSPRKHSLDQFIADTQRYVSGKIHLVLHGGRAVVTGRRSAQARHLGNLISQVIQALSAQATQAGEAIMPGRCPTRSTLRPPAMWWPNLPSFAASWQGRASARGLDRAAGHLEGPALGL